MMSKIRSLLEAFFRWIWRINGVLFLALLALCIFVIFNASGSFYPGRNDVAQEGVVAPRNRSNSKKSELRLGLMRNLKGTSMLYSPLKAIGAPSTISFSGSVSAQVHNILLFDTSTKQEHWLFTDNHQVISPPEVLERKESAASTGIKPTSRAIGLIFGVRPDSGDASGSALWNIDLASVDGRHVKTLATSVDGMMGFHFTDNAHALLVFYTAHGAAHVLDVDLATHEVHSDRLLAAPR